jgi:hypothetical protein
MPYAVVALIIGAAMAFAWSRVFGRVGWPPWLAVVAIVLPVNLIILFVLAFSRWPVEDRVAGLEREVARLRGAG